MGRKADALHPVIRAAGLGGTLPAWARVSAPRRAHLVRVADLMETWARARGLGKADRIRWRAAGLLHDALKNTSPERLRRSMGPAAEGWADPILHGPACAARLRDEGVADEPLLLAIAHHTTGHPDFDLLGESLYLADYLEPGRDAGGRRRARFRRQLPVEHGRVLEEVAAARIVSLIKRRLPLRVDTAAFWNRLLEGDGT